MNKKTAGQSASKKSGNMEKAARKNVKDGSPPAGSRSRAALAARAESSLPTGSRERVAVGIAAAASGLLLAGATLGVWVRQRLLVQPVTSRTEG